MKIGNVVDLMLFYVGKNITCVLISINFSLKKNYNAWEVN